MGALSPYLCKSLPINKWVPNAGDLEVLATWLLNFQFDSVESTTARVLFGHLNWGFDQHDELFLSHEIHVRMSCLVCDVYIKQVGEIMGSGVFESLRTVIYFELFIKLKINFF